MELIKEKYNVSIDNNLNRVLKEITQVENSINENLTSVLSKQCVIESKINKIGRVHNTLNSTNNQAIRLNTQIRYTAKLAESVSGKVRFLDVARSRAFECQQRVNDLIDLQLCCQGVTDAINEEDFEKGAAHISRFLAMDQLLLQQTADDVEGSVTSVSVSVQMLENATINMRKILEQRFDASVEKDDLASAERFFKMFPLVGLCNEGITKFTKYICEKLALKTKKELTNAICVAKLENRLSVAYADNLTTLLEHFARVIEVNTPIIELYYGKGYLLYMISILQRECDIEVKNVLMEFQKYRNISRIIHTLNEYQRSTASIAQAQSYGHYRKTSSGYSEKLDPKEIDTISGEITIMHSRLELYLRFLKRRVLADIEAREHQTDNVLEIEKLNNIYVGSNLGIQMQELLSTYLLLERYFMEESVKKAIQLDTWENTQQCSSMVDDIFFILRKSIRRSLTTQSINGVCAVINNAASCIDGDFTNYLKSTLKNGFPSGYLDLAQAYNAIQNSLQQGKLQSADNDKAKSQFLVQVNNADISTEYLETLWQTIKQEIKEQFPNMSKLEQELVENAISELKMNRESLKTCVDFGMQQLRVIALKPRINTWIDHFMNYSHYLTEDELAEYEAGETFSQFFVLQIDKLLNYFKAALTPRNFDTLVTILVTDVTVRIESAIKKCTFNRLGGLALDQDVRVLGSYFTNATSWSVRDKMTRLSQIATVLNLENISEITDYWNPNDSSSWRITPSEVKTILTLRTDFRMDDIKKLKI